MAGRLPNEAFAYYLSLEPGRRSYTAVASHFGVNRATVVRRAAKERWQDQLAGAEVTAREVVTKRFAETLAEVDARHLAVLKLLLAKGVEAIRNMPLKNARDALTAIELALRGERAMHVRDEESNRTLVVTID